MTAADRELIVAFHQQCPAANLMRRWGRIRVAPDDLTRLLARAECWVGLDAGEQVVALVCIGAVSGVPGAVDLGLQVIDRCQRQGVGTVLARHAADRARARGFHTLTAFTQASNTPMLRLLDRLGPTRHIRDGPYVEVRLALDGLGPDLRSSTGAAWP
ncbi:GNAT family N-acetyltransferase [Streptomyces sp. NPDC052101]|uniref:GNAT family N-acetyltransferase n=1 Tax=Streptomyces sp. NPDC052101 TaxID=3155763 RepID=UPI00344A8847